MPLTIQNADQTINTQEELKLFMGSLMNAIGTVQTAQGKHDPELEKIANAVQAKMGAWNKLDEQSFSLPEVRRELKKDILKPISDYVKDITIRAPKDIMTQIRLAERERSKVEDTILKAEDEYDRLKQGDSKKVALGKAIDEMIRTQLRPAEEKVEQFKSVWENHPDNKRAQLRRELENRNVFSKYAAHVASGPNLRLRAPKTAAESIQLGDYLRGLGNVLRTEGTGPNALHSSKKGGNDPELQSILNSFTDLSSSDYAKGVSAAGAEYDASKDPVRIMSGCTSETWGVSSKNRRRRRRSRRRSRRSWLKTRKSGSGRSWKTARRSPSGRKRARTLRSLTMRGIP